MATKAAQDTKTAKVQNKIPDIASLTTKAALNTKVAKIENKIPENHMFYYY